MAVTVELVLNVIDLTSKYVPFHTYPLLLFARISLPWKLVGVSVVTVQLTLRFPPAAATVGVGVAVPETVGVGVALPPLHEPSEIQGCPLPAPPLLLAGIWPCV